MKDNFFQSKYFIFVLAGFLILLIIAAGREGYRNYQISQKIDNLEKRIETLNGSNEELAEMEKYLQSEEFWEKEARLKLNLIKEGEKLVIIKKSEENQISEEEEKETKENGEISNPQKWWNYFFGKNE